MARAKHRMRPHLRWLGLALDAERGRRLSRWVGWNIVIWSPPLAGTTVISTMLRAHYLLKCGNPLQPRPRLFMHPKVNETATIGAAAHSPGFRFVLARNYGFGSLIIYAGRIKFSESMGKVPRDTAVCCPIGRFFNPLLYIYRIRSSRRHQG